LEHVKSGQYIPAFLLLKATGELGFGDTVTASGSGFELVGFDLFR
jgi:hypothetical protein